MPSFLEAAQEIAREAGGLLLERPEHLEIAHKGAVDLITQMDRRSEDLIVRRLRTFFPGHDIVAEEGHHSAGAADYRWYIDPLDGTTNYAHGFPWYAVSIALEFKGEMVAGVVFNPVSGELFCAEKGGGAFCNGRRLSVSRTPVLNESLLSTGFPYSIREKPGKTFERFRAFHLLCQGIRRPGGASLDFCNLAAGRIDGFWEEGLQSWDVAAGSLIVREAGGRLSLFDGRPFDICAREVLASNGRIHDEMLEVLKKI